MKTLLLIGGSGFFGKSFLDSFKRGQLAPWGITRVIAMARHADKLQTEVPHLITDAVELVSADIGSTDTLPFADMVIHAAASTDATKYLSHGPEERNNIQAGILNYCRLAPLFHANSRILFVSSGAVYGSQPADLAQLTEDDSSTLLSSLDMLIESKRDYAHAKRDAENAVIALGRGNMPPNATHADTHANAGSCTGLAVSIARCFAFVGPWLPRNQHFAIGNFIDDGLNNNPISVKAQHAVYRSYMHADDLVEWLMTIADNARPTCPIYNVGSDHAVLMGELAQLVADACHTSAVIPPLTDPHTDRYIPSIRKAATELGLSIRIDLPAAIQKTIDSLTPVATKPDTIEPIAKTNDQQSV